ITINLVLLALTVALPLVKKKVDQAAEAMVSKALNAVNATIFIMTVLGKVAGMYKEITGYTTRWGKISTELWNLPVPMNAFTFADQLCVAGHGKSLKQGEPGIDHHEIEKRFCLDTGDMLVVSDGPVRIWVRKADGEINLLSTKIKSAAKSYSVSSSETIKFTVRSLEVPTASEFGMTEGLIRLSCGKSKIEMEKNKITLTCGASSLEIGPAEIKLLTQSLKHNAAAVAVQP